MASAMSSFKYGAEVLWMLNKKPRQLIHLSYKNDLDIESESAEDFGQDNILAGLYRRDVPQKLMNIRHAAIGYERDWLLGLSNKFYVRQRELDPYFNFYYFKNATADDPRTRIRTTELQINTRFAYKEKFLTGTFERTSVGSNYPVLNLTYSRGVKDMFDGDYNYHRLELTVYDWFYVGALGYTSYYLRSGKIWGDVPFLLLENYPGNETYFYNTYSFNRLDEYEFTSDAYVNLFLTHHFDGLLFNKIPLLRKLKFREVITGKIGFGSLSEKNKLYHTDPTGTHYNFDDLLPYWQPQTPTWRKPYVEYGVGIENILRFFRVDLIWRPFYNSRPERPEFKAGMQLTF